MIKNNIMLVFRHILRQKQNTAINVLGLAVGLASCMLMFGYVIHELSSETMHPLKDGIFRVNGKIPMGNAIAVLVTFVSVSYQTIRAACSNPVKALRYE